MEYYVALLSFAVLALAMALAAVRARRDYYIALARRTPRLKLAEIAYRVEHSEYSDEVKRYVNCLADHAFDEDLQDEIFDGGNKKRTKEEQALVHFKEAFGKDWEIALEATQQFTMVMLIPRLAKSKPDARPSEARDTASIIDWFSNNKQFC